MFIHLFIFIAKIHFLKSRNDFETQQMFESIAIYEKAGNIIALYYD